MSDRQTLQLRRRDEKSTDELSGPKNSVSPKSTDNQERILRLQEAMRHTGHELNNILTAAYCLVDLLGISAPTATCRKYIEDLRSLLSNIATERDLLRREVKEAQSTDNGASRRTPLNCRSPSAQSQIKT